MGRNHPYIESITSTFRSRNHPAKAINSIVSPFLDAREIDGVRIAKRSVIRLPDIRLNSNVRGIDRSQKDASDDLQFVADKHRGSACLRSFHGFDPNMRPIDSGSMFPLREFYRRLPIIRA